MYSVLPSVFANRLARRPYCSDDLSAGLYIRSSETAMAKRYVQHNPPHAVAWLVFDLDYPDAVDSWRAVGLPEPSFVAVNPANGHAHVGYGLKTPVACTDAARIAPLRYAAAIEAAYANSLRADPGYAGLITKNPLHPSWLVIWGSRLYELAELAAHVDLSRKQRQAPEASPLGRNSSLFDELRNWSYSWVLKYKYGEASAEQWHTAVLAQAEARNIFDTPLALSEVKALARSVAKWTWRQFSREAFASIQSERGKRGNIKRWGVGQSAATVKPWESMGISRATFYRRQSASRIETVAISDITAVSGAQ